MNRRQRFGFDTPRKKPTNILKTNNYVDTEVYDLNSSFPV